MFLAHSALYKAPFLIKALAVLAPERTFCAQRCLKGGKVCALLRTALSADRVCSKAYVTSGRSNSKFVLAQHAEFLRTALTSRCKFCAPRSFIGGISAPCARATAEFLRTAPRSKKKKRRRDFCALRSPKGGIFCALRSLEGGISAHSARHQGGISANCARPKAEFLLTALANGRNFCALRLPEGGIYAHCARPKADVHEKHAPLGTLRRSVPRFLGVGKGAGVFAWARYPCC